MCGFSVVFNSLRPHGIVSNFLRPHGGAHQTPLSMGFHRQEYRSGLQFPPPGDLPDPGMKPAIPLSPALQVDSLPLSHYYILEQ